LFLPLSSSRRCLAPQPKLVHVFCSTKPGTEEQFRQATLKNARQSAMEEGIARFDVLQDKDDATKFVLVEVYKTADAPAKHKETSHYLEWRDTVADMMAEPRQARKFGNLFPTTMVGWDYPKKEDTDSARLE
jgi:(4S)-4-hydroxy-5-phosphonooxypentane-2,3-dione isomerase